MLDDAKRDAQTLALMVSSAGGEYHDPVRDLTDWLFSDIEGAAEPVDELRQALGLKG